MPRKTQENIPLIDIVPMVILSATQIANELVNRNHIFRLQIFEDNTQKNWHTISSVFSSQMDLRKCVV
jgi:hypothetical protein